MTTTWERYAGREDRFAVRFALRADPDGGNGVAPDVSASWGSFQIWVDGKNLCAHVDQGETLEHVHWYLLPLVEWLVAKWDPAFHEERLPVKVRGTSAAESLSQTMIPPAAAAEAEIEVWENDWYDWWYRHALRAGRDGGPFPAVTFRRWRDRIEVSWDDTPLAGGEGLSFLATGGTARLDPMDVAAPLLQAVTAVLEEFATRQPTERVMDLLRRAREIDTPERTSPRVAWMAGLRSAGGSIRDAWRGVEEAFANATQPAREAALAVTSHSGVVVGSCQATLLFGAVSPDVSAADVERLAHVLIEQYSPGAESEQLVALTRPVPVPTEMPAWQDGYELADEAREALELDPDAPVDIDSVLEALGIEVRHETLDDRNIRGVALASPEHRPTIVVNDESTFAQSMTAQRFTKAHELCHLLFDRAQGRRLAVASGPWAPREVEQRANAFAANFLMPPEGLQHFLAGLNEPVNSPEAVEQIAEHFGVGYVALIEHLRNVEILDDVDRARLRGWPSDGY